MIRMILQRRQFLTALVVEIAGSMPRPRKAKTTGFGSTKFGSTPFGA